MSQVQIRPATAADIPVLIRHRRMMWWDMGRRDEAALRLMEPLRASTSRRRSSTVPIVDFLPQTPKAMPLAAQVSSSARGRALWGSVSRVAR